MKLRYLTMIFLWATCHLGAEPSAEANIDEELTVLGIYESLGENRLNIRIVDNQFRVYVVDEKNIVQEPGFEDVYMEVLTRKNKNKGWRGVLEANGKPYMSFPRAVYTPWVFNLRVILRFDDGETKAFGRLPFRQDYSASQDDD